MATLYILGAGTPTPTTSRFGTAQLVHVNDDYLLVDCGPGTTRSLAGAGLCPTRVTHLFFTHHHFDHNAGFPCFVLCRWDQGGSNLQPLRVWGPPPTTRFCNLIAGPDGAFSPDLRARINAPASQRVHVKRGGELPRAGMNIVTTDIQPGQVVQQQGWTMLAGATRHVQPWLESVAYRLETTSGCIVFTGDTGPCREVSELARGADLLVANCWGLQRELGDSEEAQAMFTAHQAATLAQDAGARTLVLTHLGAWFDDAGKKEQARREVAGVYHGNTIWAEEGLRIEL